MPDKEFDNLFRDKFKDAEIEPSANLWANIERELTPQRKRKFPVYWMAAATVALALTATLVFQKKEVIQLRAPEETAQKKPAINEADAISIPDVEKASEPVQVASKGSQVSRKMQAKEEVTTDAVNENNAIKNQIGVQPAVAVERLPIKQQDPRPIDVVPIKPPVETQTVIAQAPVEKVEDNTISETVSSERKGIRNVGDLVNYVVEKVDKREKKLVRFNTDDDDNSSIIGINIGFLKLNKKSKDK